MTTRKITLEIPKELRLGQAIMIAFGDKYKEAVLSGTNKQWDIWEQDEKAIQDRINNIPND